MQRITRICFNTKDWRCPSGDAKKHEAGTYNDTNGFGHEEWLFRSDWLIDGWRYAFLQGVNRSHARLVHEGQPIDLTLFTIQPDKKRRMVATIYEMECLADQQAQDALEEFKRQGWYDTMQKEILDVGGNAKALGAEQWAKHVLNIRFRQENVRPFPPATYAPAGDPILTFNRYNLSVLPTTSAAHQQTRIGGRSGAARPSSTQPYSRRAGQAVECTPEHARMQERLYRELKAEYPKAHVVLEENFIDVSVRTVTEWILFEIKSDLAPRTVIRHALGQILEYAFHPSCQHNALPPRLVIVGRRPLTPDDQAYMARLNQDFRMPVEYRVVAI